MEEKLKEIFAAVLGIKAEMVGDDTEASNIENWDSLKHMNLIVAVESEFDIEIEEEDIIELMSYNVMLDKIKELV